MTRSACALLVTFALATGALVLVLLVPIVSRPGTVDVSDLRNLAFQPNAGARLPLSATLVDEGGGAVALGKYFTKSPVILVLDYLRCTSLCGVTMHGVVDALAGLPLEPGRDYRLIAISIDPRDTPNDAAAARRKYAWQLGRNGETGMHFLTATSETAVREIADTVGFPYQYDTLLDAYIHPAGFVIATPDGVISRYVEGVAITPPELVGALADAEQDKSQGPLARLLLLCHVQSAPLGRFTVPVLAAFMIADIAAGIASLAMFAAIRRRRDG